MTPYAPRKFPGEDPRIDLIADYCANWFGQRAPSDRSSHATVSGRRHTAMQIIELMDRAAPEAGFGPAQVKLDAAYTEVGRLSVEREADMERAWTQGWQAGASRILGTANPYRVLPDTQVTVDDL